MISYREHKTNEYVPQQVSLLAGHQKFLLSTVKRRKYSWFGHVCRLDTLLTTILQGIVEGGCRKKKTAEITEGHTGQHHGMDVPVIVVVAANRRRQRSMGNHHSRDVRQSILNDALAPRELVI